MDRFLLYNGVVKEIANNMNQNNRLTIVTHHDPSTHPHDLEVMIDWFPIQTSTDRGILQLWYGPYPRVDVTGETPVMFFGKFYADGSPLNGAPDDIITFPDARHGVEFPIFDPNGSILMSITVMTLR